MIGHYTLHYSREAIQAIYQIPRGTAANVTSVIQRLTQEPRPTGSQPLERPNSYFLNIENYLVVYEIDMEAHIVRILRIE